LDGLVQARKTTDGIEQPKSEEKKGKKVKREESKRYLKIDKEKSSLYVKQTRDWLLLTFPICRSC
jgi:hypothetical protein